MKNTIIALAASVVALGSVNAQVTFTELVQFTSFDIATETAVGTFGGGTVNFSTGDDLVNSSNGDRLNLRLNQAGTGSAPAGVTTLTFSAGITNPVFEFDNLASGVQFPTGSEPQILFNTPAGSVTASGDNLNQSTVFVPNPDTTVQLQGTFTSISFTPTSTFGDSISFRVGTIPEPSSALLLGLSALGFLGRRKR